MKRLELNPHGWPCKLTECPPGLFLYNDSVCMKTEYGDIEAYCDTGEAFSGGGAEPEKRAALIVQPLVSNWVEE